MDMCVHVCAKGHVIHSREWISGKKFCEVCGAEMFDKCPSCGLPIREWNASGTVITGKPHYERAAYCRGCGKPYPWTLAASPET